MRTLRAEKQIQTIIENYFICKNQFKVLSFSTGEIDYTNPYYIYYRDVEITYHKLEEFERVLMENDYFSPKDEKWWEKYFSSGEYRLFKVATIRKFVRLFYETH